MPIDGHRLLCLGIACLYPHAPVRRRHLTDASIVLRSSLYKYAGHSDAIGTNLRRILGEHRASNNKYISTGPSHIVPRVLLNLCPGGSVVLCVLWNDVCETEALDHRRRRGHVSCWGHVAAAVPRALVVLELRTFAAREARIGCLQAGVAYPRRG